MGIDTARENSAFSVKIKAKVYTNAGSHAPQRKIGHASDFWSIRGRTPTVNVAKGDASVREARGKIACYFQPTR